MKLTDFVDDPEDTEHSPVERAAAASRSTWISVIVNLLLTSTQVTVGLFSRSKDWSPTAFIPYPTWWGMSSCCSPVINPVGAQPPGHVGQGPARTHTDRQQPKVPPPDIRRGNTPGAADHPPAEE
jgi:hypothetical protein